MSQHAVRALASEIHGAIDRFRTGEWDITYEEVIGTLWIVLRDVTDEVEKEDDDA